MKGVKGVHTSLGNSLLTSIVRLTAHTRDGLFVRLGDSLSRLGDSLLRLGDSLLRLGGSLFYFLKKVNERKEKKKMKVW